ncbi:hypothetical protein PFICI_00168 [Pestalotiopsis fici W106-1]|uniref:Protein kinase domain-containing protein n=1 Tax=Pestalotiopsis fici (strain W106-1 / CGMCC3.15140) TaxID=1229662 RepID=W3XK14_PESFW|nr:uncharacterized protein PFICI_00168 [Pestalotiopsis fici W106-1]ETS86340.1 hypothetical protein PFICI_00168 [Pestalotiopsis fici W106-1]
MIGRQYDTPEFPEHSLLPPMKLIDLGEAYEAGTRAASENIHKVSLRILSLIARRQIRPREKSTYKDYETLATEILPHGNGKIYPNLDNELRDLVAQCVSTDSKKRPTLEELLTATQDGANKGTDAYKPHDARESDSAIHELMKKILYDANPEERDSSIPNAGLGEGGDVEGRDSPAVGRKRIFSIGSLSVGSLRISKRRKA